MGSVVRLWLFAYALVRFGPRRAIRMRSLRFLMSRLLEEHGMQPQAPLVAKASGRADRITARWRRRLSPAELHALMEGLREEHEERNEMR